MTVDSIRHWFKNQRQKERRIATQKTTVIVEDSEEMAVQRTTSENEATADKTSHTKSTNIRSMNIDESSKCTLKGIIADEAIQEMKDNNPNVVTASGSAAQTKEQKATQQMDETGAPPK